MMMTISVLSAQVSLLNQIDDAFTYRLALSGLLLQYGRDQVRQAMIEGAHSVDLKVASIASAPGWCAR